MVLCWFCAGLHGQTASTVKYGSFGLYLVPTALLNVSLKLKQKLFYNEQVLVGSLPVVNEEGSSNIRPVKRMEDGDMRGKFPLLLA